MLGEAKEQAEIDEEKEMVETSTIQAMGKNKFGNIEQSELQAFLDSNAGKGKTQTIDGEDTLVVKFIESDRYYEVDSNGNVSEPVEIIVDNYAGDLTKGGRCDGSEEKPFEINCIEDLVAFSIMTNGGNSGLGLISSNFSGKYVVLTRTLDFNSIISYSDFTTIKYGDLNTDGTIENIKTELTKKNEGCIGFTPMKIFFGTFNGNNCEIKNIYENKYGIAGLFENLGNGAKISNLTISGNITSIDGQAAGLVGKAGNRTFTLGEVIIENCTNKANINANTYAGGILCLSTMYIQPIANNCNNFGNILSKTASAGGITGTTYYGNIINSGNDGNVISEEGNAGGITGNGLASYGKVINCYNTGKITGDKETGGLNAYSSGTIINSFDIGIIESITGKASGISVGGWDSKDTNNIIKNCYTLSNIIGKQIAAITYSKVYLVENCYYRSGNNIVDVNGIAMSDELMKADGSTDTEETKALLTLLNNYVSKYNSENKNDENYIELKNWKLNKETGYPKFE